MNADTAGGGGVAAVRGAGKTGVEIVQQHQGLSCLSVLPTQLLGKQRALRGDLLA